MYTCDFVVTMIMMMMMAYLTINKCVSKIQPAILGVHVNPLNGNVTQSSVFVQFFISIISLHLTNAYCV